MILIMDDHDLEEQKLLNFLGDPHTQLRYSCSENNNSDHYFPPNYQYHPHLQQQYNFNHRNNYHRHSGQRRQDQNERSYEPLDWKTRTDDTNSNSAQVSTGTMIPDDVLDDFIAVVEEFNQQDRLKQKPNSQPTRSTPNKSKGFERNLSRSITFNKEEDISINKKKIPKSATKSTSKTTAKQDGDSQDDKRTHRRSKSDDSSSSVVYSVEVPIKADVLCGQSRVCANHPGNKYFQEVLDRFASTYDRATSKREDPKGLGRRLRRQRVLLGGKKAQTGVPMYNSQGRLLYCNRDLCDCLKLDCPGCFYPCARCKSPKCGLECRIGRRWTVKWIYCEARPSVTTDNPFLLPILQQLKKDKQENKS